ncbi:MAG: class I SAM-dependent methyltransferase [Gemmatimonadales bacterium]|nr:class I SAM-dependent methyltransferase [Gemmatimonadales bacterium]
MKESEYYGHPRREMIAHVPAAAGTVLDIGCGSGTFAASLRQERNPDLELWGVEMDPDAARRAAKILDHVHVGDAAKILPDLPKGHFDCIVCNDVLEHVAHPDTMLRAIIPLVRPGGRIVASIPNVRYFFNVLDLVLHGRWEYTDEGILDRTHLRFFTRSSIESMFAECGFEIESMTGINPTGSIKFKIVNLLTLGRWQDMKYLQFAVVGMVLPIRHEIPK